ncbi:MAG: hypothetical protein IJ840_02810 [Bacteroidales bacterium]|nr:hypothetical protein [Bacteroidales bacterium]
MKRFLILATSLLLAASSSMAAPMKARVIQQPFALDPAGLEDCFRWTIDELLKCDESLDIIVLPEFSEVPGKTASGKEFIDVVRRLGPTLLETCEQTARKCHALVFAGAIDMTTEVPRNTIFVFDREGNVIGKYYKEHLTRGEWDMLDMSYTEEWTQPYILDIEGVRYAFLTCYDFYFYENFSNIARWKPDVIIGSSHQRSDTFRALDIINTFCAYNTGAYLVRASVSMGLDSELGGCSCVVAPTGEILGTLRSEIASLDVTFDPKKKYLKPAGYGNPPALHSEYIEIGRRPWKYRPGGGAIVPPYDESPSKRLCAVNGISSLAAESLVGALGAAAAVGASEISFDVNASSEGKKALENILRKLSCHSIMNIHLSGAWKENDLRDLLGIIFTYDALGHCYLTSSDESVLETLNSLGTKIPRCLASAKVGSISDAASRLGCEAIEIPAGKLGDGIVRKAREGGLRICAVAISRAEAEKAVKLGADTILTTDYLATAESTGLR